MNHIVFFSGGIGSWCAAKRVVDAHGADSVRLLFTDTHMEDPDLYRFLQEGSALLAARLVWLGNGGRTPWDIFHDVRYLGNTRIDPCSRILKRERARTWIEKNCDPAETVLYLGIDWTEEHRCEAIRKNWPYTVRFPLCEPPYIDKDQQHETAAEAGLRPPALTAKHGFPHNNCAGFCVKAGHAHFKHLLEKYPDRYAYHEKKEQELREYLDKDVSILRDRSAARIREAVGPDVPEDELPNQVPLTLRALRERLQAGETEDPQCKLDWGGCGCFTDHYPVGGREPAPAPRLLNRSSERWNTNGRRCLSRRVCSSCSC